MEKRRSWFLTGMFLLTGVWGIGLFGMPLFLTEVRAADSIKLEVYDPTGGMEVTQVHASRLDTLAGKTICELSINAWQAHRVLPEIRRLLQDRFPTAKFIPFTEFPVGNEGADSDKTADLIVKRGCNAVIIGNAG
jgi:hypothetical protein